MATCICFGEGNRIKLPAVAEKHIILTGFMGTGKTAVGQVLAARLERCLVDTDEVIEKEAGLTIAQIFEGYGEEYFRDLESKVISGLGGYRPGSLVVSTGGGAVIREANRKIFFKLGIVILLSASTKAILQRVQATGERPLLEGEKLKEKIGALWAEREAYYRQCHLEIDTSDRRPEEVALEIIRILNLW